MPRKQRHTAKRVFDRLRDECGFTGGYTIIKDYMREREQHRQEVFVPLSHPPGHAQADFGEATVVTGGLEQKARFFVLDLPHSDGCYPAAVAEAWVNGHIHAFAFFGAVPQSIVDDNDRCPPQYRYGAPRLGEHNWEILSELGYTARDVDELVESGAVGSGCAVPPSHVAN